MAEKIRIGLPESAFPFMPPADKFMAYLGIPGGIAGVVNKLSRRPEQPSLIDPKTVRKAVREGVSPRSFAQIKGILDSVLTPEMYEYINSPDLLPWMETTLRQNGLSWLCIARGMRLRFSQTVRPETFTERFIRRRAEQEMELLQIGQQIQEMSPSSEAFDERWCEYLSGFLKQRTEVEPARIDYALQAWLALKSKADKPHKEKIGTLFGLYTRLRVDFYHQLLCNLSLDLIQWFKEKEGIAGQEQWLIENSLFGDMVPVFDGRRLTLPFEQLIDSWRRNAAPDGGDLSWTQVAQNLPDPHGVEMGAQSVAAKQTREDREAAIQKNKKSRLREWRQGTRPKLDQLEQFVRNLVPNDNDMSSAMMRADISCIWGAFILDELALFEEYGLSDLLHETLPALESFPAYWADYQSQAAQILAA
ncbi:hypothetical protein LL273_13945 [Marinobacter salarius]|uniref:hypothetical protein n=1 Tax=Marinobacter salarius TaxID=1420917 RepID=UPI001D187BED|nr:hypothetical protein [Marinobacter salarius]MCC4284828.1 hypothetical protein [Marinobacter salarius]